MASVNLYEYVKNWLFLKNLEEKNPYDLIIFEKFSNNELDVKNINIKTLDDLGYEFWTSWAINHYVSKYKNVLIVLDTLSIIYLLPIIKNLKNNLSIINLWTWLTGYINKGLVDDDDLAVMSNYDIDIYEPFDLDSLFSTLNINNSKYIRISNKELPIKLFWEEEWMFEIKEWLIWLDEYWLSGNDWIILCWWYMLSECLNAMAALQEEWKYYSVYIIWKHNYSINESLLNHINNSNKIIYIVDNKISNWAKKQIIWKLASVWIYDCEIKIVSPNFENINTNLKDYIFEQAEYDSQHLFEKLNNI